MILKIHKNVLSGSTTIEKYDLRTNTWTQVGIMNGRRLQFGVAVIDNKLYVVGGRDGLKTSNTVECYDSLNKVWSTMPPMSTHRHGLGTAFTSFIIVLLLSYNWNFPHILTSVVNTH